MNVLDEIIALTAAIEARIDAAEWAEAAALDTERRRLLTEYLAGRSTTGTDTDSRQVLTDLLQRNNRLISQVDATRTTLGEAIRNLDDAPAVVRAYRQNAAPLAAATE